jgi:predicted regulator of Ras-like GTPase activity (Roadblock/LC7/MglB family)
MINFSEAISQFKDLPSVEGILITDTDGMVVGNAFLDKDLSSLIAPTMYEMLLDITKHMTKVGENANQVCLILSKKLIIIQPVYDTILIIYTQKKNLDLLQSRIKSAVGILQSIARQESLTT